MCLIFIKPKTATNYLTKDRFENALTNNPHAVGIVYRAEDGIKIERFVKPEAKKEEIWNIIKDKEEFAIHFRYATHGILNLTNTHPFIVTKGLCMMHNGVMSEFGDLNKDWSDTKNFVEYFLKPYIEQEGIDVVHSDEFKSDLEKVIGNGNKLLFIDKDFNFSIINEKQGVWKDGCWLSNTYSVEPPYSSYYSTYAPKDGTAATSTKYNWDDDYNYGSYDGYNYGTTKFNSVEDMVGNMTMQDINDYIADQILDYEYGGIKNSDIPFELNVDQDYVKTLKINDRDTLYWDISEDVRSGTYKGTNPCVWELVVKQDDIEPFLIKDEFDYEDEDEAYYNALSRNSEMSQAEKLKEIANDIDSRNIVFSMTNENLGVIYGYVAGGYSININGYKSFNGKNDELKKAIKDELLKGKTSGTTPLNWNVTFEKW